MAHRLIDMVCCSAASTAASTQKGWSKTRRGLKKAIKVWKIFPAKTRTLQFGKGITGERLSPKNHECPADGEVVLAVWLFSQEKNWSACRLEVGRLQIKGKESISSSNVKLNGCKKSLAKGWCGHCWFTHIQKAAKHSQKSIPWRSSCTKPATPASGSQQTANC